MIHNYIDEAAIGDQLIPRLTPNQLTTQINQLPLLNHHLHKNTTEMQHRFMDVLSRMPSKSDRPGYIYGFRNKKSYNSHDMKYEIKLGRTSKQIPQNRIFEWQKTDMQEYVQIFTVRSEFNFKLELLVHLLFAYARKTLIINGKKRIEWFQFGEKVATAAITNQLNLLMEHIHEKYIDNLPHLQPPTDTQIDYDGLLQRIKHKYIIHKQESGIAMFGLPKTGKSVLRSILLQEEITVTSKGKKLQLKTKNRQKRDSLFIQISTANQHTDTLKQLEHQFTKCLELCHPSLFPILVVRQSDIESSTLIGLTHALNGLEKYVKVGDRLLVVVTKAAKEYSKSDIVEAVSDGQKFMSRRHWQLLKNSQFILVKTPLQQGPFLSNTQSLQIRKQVIGYFEMQKQRFMQLQPKLQQNILSLCYQIIQKSYEVLQQLYAKAFKQKYLQFIQEQDQIGFANTVRQLIAQIKQPQKQTLLQIYTSITKLAAALELCEKSRLQSYLYMFCEMCYNRSMQLSNIFQCVSQSINQNMDVIIQTYNKKLADRVQNFKLSICDYVYQGNTDALPLLKHIMQLDTLDQINSTFRQITQKEQSSAKKQAKRLAQFITSLAQLIEEISRFSQLGLKFNSVDGRVRQAIYYALKNHPSKNPVP